MMYELHLNKNYENIDEGIKKDQENSTTSPKEVG